MPLVPAVCTQCGAPIEVDNAKEAGICPHCGTAFITEKAINNYITQHVSSTSVSQTIVKNIYGREKTEAEEYVARGLSFLGLGEYGNAENCFAQAVEAAPGDIENHILLLRAQTRDFRAYYLTDSPEFDRIEKLAQTADMAAIQEKYGFPFRRDKEYRLRAYREAATLRRAQNGDLRKRFSDVGLYIDADAAAERAVSALCADGAFTDEERAAFLEEYIDDFTDPATGVLTVFTAALFPQKDGFYDLTEVKRPVRFTHAREKNLRLCAENFYRSGNYAADEIRIAAAGTFDAGSMSYLHADTLVFEEGVEEIVCTNSSPTILTPHVVFPDSLRSIGQNSFRLPKGIFSLQFGSGLRSVGSRAFATYDGETADSETLELPEGLEELAGGAFFGCRIKTAVLPKSLKRVGPFLFSFSKNTSVYGVMNDCMLICRGSTSEFSPDWCRRPNSLPDKPEYYTVFEVPNNTVYMHFPPSTPEQESAEREGLRRYKRFADFDENQTEFCRPGQQPQPPAKKGGCYIATAVYGSYDCPQVWTLRRYRDFSLSRTAPGRLFVKLYYAVSPALVKLFGKQRWFRSLWKKFLDRKVARLNARGFEDSPYKDL